jgi:hypothetical protein
LTLPLRIAFDMDGVLADMEAELVRQAEVLFGRPMIDRLQERVGGSGPNIVPGGGAAGDTPAESTDPAQAAAEASPDNVPPLLRLNMSSRQQRKLWHHVESIDNFWQTLDETEPGIVARLAAIASDRRWEVIFLTKRPESAGATAQVQSQRWLESKGFALPSVYVVQGSRGRIAAALGLDIVIDDRPENCLDIVVDSRARAILVWREDEKQLPAAARRLGIGVVKTVGDCLDLLTQSDPKDREQRGVVDRVKRLLGLKEPASA